MSKKNAPAQWAAKAQVVVVEDVETVPFRMRPAEVACLQPKTKADKALVAQLEAAAPVNSRKARIAVAEFGRLRDLIEGAEGLSHKARHQLHHDTVAAVIEAHNAG